MASTIHESLVPGTARAVARGAGVHHHHGRPVRVDPIKLTLKAPGTKGLKLKHDELLSSFGFNLSLRRYMTVWNDLPYNGSGVTSRIGLVGRCRLTLSNLR